jgi:signal transduction histidine kinase
LPSPRPAEIDLAALVRDVLEFAAPELDRARVAVELAAPDRAVVAIDEAQVRQALVNLIRNAREAMNDGGRLGVRLSIERLAVRLELEDDGPGIDDDLRARIFDPFFTTKSTGTGLGLPITKQIVEAHGGSIACDAVAPHGTRFTLTFPLSSRAEGPNGNRAATDRRASPDADSVEISGEHSGEAAPSDPSPSDASATT